VAGLYLATIVCFSFLSLAALAVARLDHLMPGTQVMTPRFFGQLLGLHRVLLRDFVFWPAIPAVLGLGLVPGLLKCRDLAFPRVARLSYGLFLFGGLSMIWAFLWGGIEPGWAHAVASEAARPASASMLLGLFCAALAALLVAVNLIATLHEKSDGDRTIFHRCLYAVAWMQALAGPVYLCAILLGLLHGLTGLRIFDPAHGGDATLLPLLYGFATAPLAPTIVLGCIGAVAAALRPERVLSPERVRHIGYAVAAMAILGLLAVDARALPVAISPRLSLVGSFFKTLWLVPLFALLVPLMEAVFVLPGRWNAARLYALAALLLTIIAAPLDVFLGLPASAYFAVGYLGSAADYLLLGGGCLLALLSVLSSLGAVKSPTREALGVVAVTVLVLGLATTVGPMFVLGKGGLSMDVAVYPATFLVWQVLVLAGGTIFAVGLFLAALALLGGRVPARAHAGGVAS
jgi:cytochrome c oxidase subunit 1